MIRLHGTSPNGKERRVLDIIRLDERSGGPGVAVWVRSPESDSGWQINFNRDEIVHAIDFLLNQQW